MGKPRIEIDRKKVEGYAQMGSPVAEIAAALGVSEWTIRHRFKDLVQQSSAVRKIRLRQHQWKSVEKGSVPMQIFLGKHELGQGDETAQQEDRVIIRRAVKREAATPSVPSTGNPGEG
jgi:predicted transcriptional regulator